jgi:hypothetical protein
MGFGVLFVRQLTQDEVDTFRRVSKCAIDGRLALRYQAIWFSHLGKSVQEIAELLDVSVESVRNWIHIFEEDGFEGLADDWRSGRPPKANEAYIERLLDMVHISSLRAEHGEQGPLPSGWQPERSCSNRPRRSS